MQCLSYAMCSSITSMLSLKVLRIYIHSSIVHTANIEIRECVKWSLTRSQKQWKIIKRQWKRDLGVCEQANNNGDAGI